MSNWDRVRTNLAEKQGYFAIPSRAARSGGWG